MASSTNPFLCLNGSPEMIRTAVMMYVQLP
jgi:hypothetical protein